MEFRILGSLEAHAGPGRRAPLGGPREHRLLAALLIENHHVVAMDRLIEAVWECDPPPTADKLVRNLVSRVKQQLGPLGGAGLIEAAGGGYRISVAEHELDAARFEALAARAGRLAAAGEPGEAAALYEAALELWRGPALSGLSGRVIETAAAAWNERRLATAEAHVDCLLELGRPEQAVSVLTALVSENPLRQRLIGQLMLALHHSGRQPEALTLYQDSRKRLAEEFGLDPGPQLRALHEQILAGRVTGAAPAPRGQAQRAVSADDERVAAGARTSTGTSTGAGANVRSAAAPGAAAVPRQLPAGVRHFVGRTEQISALTDMLRDAAEPGGTVVISAIGGTAGIGKTALAVHWARQIADRFDDGQLYVNLRGFDPAKPPVPPRESLRGFLDALGVPPARVPPGLDAQIGLYRSLMADKRVLVLLDNAHDAGQVRPLLPGGRECVVVVTSRRRLTGLVATEGAQPVTLGLLTDDESRELLERRLGAQRVAAEPDAVAHLIELCARLPLALSIAAAHAAVRPDVPLTELVMELRGRSSPLDAFESDDAPTDLRAVFSWSYEGLSAQAARMFRHLGLHPGSDCSLAAAARLTDLTTAAARGLLEELERAHLIAEHVPGRFAFHDLLAAYASERAEAHETEDARREASRRVLDHYLDTAQSAAQLLDPTRGKTAGAGTGADADTEAERISDHRQALAWFEAEQSNLMAAMSHADRLGLDAYAWQIPWALTTYFDRRGRWADLSRALEVALVAAERCDDLTGQARAHRGLGNCAVQLNEFAAAERRYEAALEIYRRLGDPSGQAMTLIGLSWAAARDNRHDRALQHANRSLDLFRRAGNRVGLANALNSVGWQHAKMADYGRALDACREAVRLQHELGDRQGEAATLDSLGYTHHHLGDYEEAISCYRQALELRSDLGDRYSRAGTLTRIGDAYLAAGNPDAARETWLAAAAILEELGHPDCEEVRAKLAQVSA